MTGPQAESSSPAPGVSRKDFLRILPERWESIDRLFASSGRDPNTANVLQTRIKQLAGAARLFDFQHLAELAGEFLQAPSNDETAALIKEKLGNEVARIMGSNNSSHTGHTILLIDDDPSVLAYLSEQLRQFDYTVVTASHASELPALLNKHTIDALIVDIALTEGPMAGPEHVEKLRTLHGTVPPLIFISATGSFKARLAALRAGGKAYFLKPVNVSELAHTLDRLMPGHVPQPISVLCVDDSASVASYHASVLQSHGMVTRTESNPTEVMNVLSEFPTEVIVMDWHMPECTGFEVAAILRQQEQFLGIPIIYLSSERDPQLKHAALLQGGDEFLQKPTREEDLVRSVQQRAMRFRSLRQRMTNDGLTGLLNHTHFEQQLDGEMARSLRLNAPLCLAMIDIDHFKKVNDTHGHPVGDQVIRTLAQLLKQRLRKSDLIGRYGGEEFAVCLPNSGLEDAERVINEVRTSFSNIAHRGAQGVFQVTISAGVAELTPDRTKTLTTLADEALYMAKRGGRNQVRRA